MGIEDLLRGCELFNELYEEEINAFVKNCNVLQYEEGGVVIERDEKVQNLYIVLSGKLLITREYPETTMKIQYLYSGDVTGELVFQKEYLSREKVEALEESSVLQVPYEHILSYFNKNTSVYGVIVTNLCDLIMSRYKTYSDILYRVYPENTIAIRTPIFERRHREVLSQKDRKKYLDDGDIESRTSGDRRRR